MQNDNLISMGLCVKWEDSISPLYIFILFGLPVFYKVWYATAVGEAFFKRLGLIPPQIEMAAANNNIFFPCLWLNLHKFNFIISQRNFYGGLFGSVQPEVNVSVFRPCRE